MTSARCGSSSRSRRNVSSRSVSWSRTKRSPCSPCSPGSLAEVEPASPPRAGPSDATSRNVSQQHGHPGARCTSSRRVGATPAARRRASRPLVRPAGVAACLQWLRSERRRASQQDPARSLPAETTSRRCRWVRTAPEGETRMRISDTSDLWWKTAVIYCLDVQTFMDWNDDGMGDFTGLAERLDYLAELGVTCLWLMPFYPTTDRDDGYDITDYYGVDPRLGSAGDFVEVVRTARDRGMRVIIDLVVNHTSDRHPWFRAARSSRTSPYRDFYVWRVDEP